MHFANVIVAVMAEMVTKNKTSCATTIYNWG
jgi:hypothetical protein